MQTRRANPLSPLAIVLPHPPIPRRTSSLLSLSSAASPRTPRSCGSPSNSIFVPPPPNRKSTDSWNSSNADDLEWEWKQEQVLLLSRTLDALPAHLVTPFNGPIPPSNLLDKIARGVSQAKGSVDWPHSLRATRVKLIELSRLRAKEQAAAEQRRKSIAEEPEDTFEVEMEANYTYATQDGGENPLASAPGAKRPLYRQSSMDFMSNAVGSDIKNNEHLARLSSRLQRAERQAAHHPYTHSSRNNGCTSPPPSSTVPSLVSPSTPSSSTLNTLSSLSVQRHHLRRTVSSVSSSSLSIISSSSDGILPNPRVRRLMQDDDRFAPAPPPKDTPMSSSKAGAKRASSFGALAQEARREYLAQSPDNGGHSRKNSSTTCPSSDEEEKVRSKQAKKARKLATPSSTRATPPPESPAPSTPISSPVAVRRGAVRSKELTSNTRASRSPREDRSENKERERSSKDKTENPQSQGRTSRAKPSTQPQPMNLQRNPSMFGPELPQLPDNAPLSPAPIITSSSRLPQYHNHLLSPSPTRSAPRALASTLRSGLSPSPSASGSPMLSPAADITGSLPSPKVKTLRRVRRLAPARRISFSSLIPPGDEADADGEGDGEEKGGKIELGSAFQLH